MIPFTVSGCVSLLGRLLPEPHAGLLAGLLFGTKAELAPDFYDALIATGTLHIVALSGMNITIMEGLLGAVLVPFVGRRWASAITIGVIAWFVWFVGPSPSIVRAAIMGSLTLLAVISGRQYWALLSWGLAVGGMLVIRFSWLFDVSFQLSAAASLGIILFGGSGNLGPETVAPERPSTIGSPGSSVSCAGSRDMPGPVHTFVAAVKEVIRLTLAAQVFTIPIIFWQFRRISLISVLANLAIGWVIVPITALGWMTVLAGWGLLYAGQIIAWIDWVLLEYLIRTIYFLSRLPFASLEW